MKTIIMSFCLMLSIVSANALNTDTEDPKEALTKQLTEIVSTSSIWNGLESETKLMVNFMINGDNELVILSTNNQAWDAAVKNLLNYRKIEVNPVLKNKIFHLPIKLEKKV